MSDAALELHIQVCPFSWEDGGWEKSLKFVWCVLYWAMLMGRGLGFHGSCFGAEGQCDLHMAWNTQGHQTEPAPPWQVIPRILRGQIQVSGPVAGLQAGESLPVAQPPYGALPEGCLALWMDFSQSGQA